MPSRSCGKVTAGPLDVKGGRVLGIKPSCPRWEGTCLSLNSLDKDIRIELPYSLESDRGGIPSAGFRVNTVKRSNVGL